MAKNERGRMWVSKVTLAPAIAFSGEKRPTPSSSTSCITLAHEECFIANSVKSEVVVKARHVVCLINPRNCECAICRYA